MALATSSLPTPLSPVISTLASDRAMRSISCDRSAMTELVPMSCSGVSRRVENASRGLIAISGMLRTRLLQKLLETPTTPIVHRGEDGAEAGGRLDARR